eukprot:g3270.t1
MASKEVDENELASSSSSTVDMSCVLEMTLGTYICGRPLGIALTMTQELNKIVKENMKRAFGREPDPKHRAPIPSANVFACYRAIVKGDTRNFAQMMEDFRTIANLKKAPKVRIGVVGGKLLVKFVEMLRDPNKSEVSDALDVETLLAEELGKKPLRQLTQMIQGRNRSFTDEEVQNEVASVLDAPSIDDVKEGRYKQPYNQYTKAQRNATKCAEVIADVATQLEKYEANVDPRELWLAKCRECVGNSMLPYTNANDTWDLYTLGRILCAHLPSDRPKQPFRRYVASEKGQKGEPLAVLLTRVIHKIELRTLRAHAGDWKVEPPTTRESIRCLQDVAKVLNVFECKKIALEVTKLFSDCRKDAKVETSSSTPTTLSKTIPRSECGKLGFYNMLAAFEVALDAFELKYKYGHGNLNWPDAPTLPESKVHLKKTIKDLKEERVRICKNRNWLHHNESGAPPSPFERVAKDMTRVLEDLGVKPASWPRWDLAFKELGRDSGESDAGGVPHVTLTLERRKEAMRIPRPKDPYFAGRTKILGEIEAALMDTTGTRVLCHGLPGVGKDTLISELVHRDRIRRANEKAMLQGWIVASTDADFEVMLHDLFQSDKPDVVDGLDNERKKALEKIKEWLGENDDWLLVLEDVPAGSSVLTKWIPKGKGRVVVTSQTDSHGAYVFTKIFEVKELNRDECLELWRKMGIAKLIGQRECVVLPEPYKTDVLKADEQRKKAEKMKTKSETQLTKRIDAMSKANGALAKAEARFRSECPETLKAALQYGETQLRRDDLLDFLANKEGDGNLGGIAFDVAVVGRILKAHRDCNIDTILKESKDRTVTILATHERGYNPKHNIRSYGVVWSVKLMIERMRRMIFQRYAGASEEPSSLIRTTSFPDKTEDEMTTRFNRQDADSMVRRAIGVLSAMTVCPPQMTPDDLFTGTPAKVKTPIGIYGRIVERQESGVDIVELEEPFAGECQPRILHMRSVVDTPFGSGTVMSRRPDGMLEVELNTWTLTKGSPVRVYLDSRRTRESVRHECFEMTAGVFADVKDVLLRSGLLRPSTNPRFVGQIHQRLQEYVREVLGLSRRRNDRRSNRVVEIETTTTVARRAQEALMDVVKARFLPILKEIGDRDTIEARRTLRPVVERLFGSARVFPGLSTSLVSRRESGSRCENVDLFETHVKSLIALELFYERVLGNVSEAQFFAKTARDLCASVRVEPYGSGTLLDPSFDPVEVTSSTRDSYIVEVSEWTLTDQRPPRVFVSKEAANIHFVVEAETGLSRVELHPMRSDTSAAERKFALRFLRWNLLRARAMDRYASSLQALGGQHLTEARHEKERALKDVMAWTADSFIDERVQERCLWKDKGANACGDSRGSGILSSATIGEMTEEARRDAEIEVRRLRKERYEVISFLLNNLGGVLNSLGGLEGATKKKYEYFEEAKKTYEASLKMRYAIYGTDKAHPSIATSLHNLGGVLESLGDLEGATKKKYEYFEEAKKKYEACLTMEYAIYGTDKAHPSIANSLNNLGGVLKYLGDLEGAKKKKYEYFEEATKQYEACLKMYYAIYGTDKAHPSIATSLNNLGAVLISLGDLEGAKKKKYEYFEEAKKKYEASLKISLGNLEGATKKKYEYFEEAKKKYEACLTMRYAIYGTDKAHPSIATSLHNLGSVLKSLGDLEGAKKKKYEYFEEAKKKYEASLKMYDAIYGTDKAHPSIATSLNNLGAIATSLHNLGGVLKSLGDLEGATKKKYEYFEDAKKTYEASLKMRHAICGTKAHPLIAATLINMSETAHGGEVSRVGLHIFNRDGSEAEEAVNGGDVFRVGMRIFNRDGSEAEACGNALRCVAAWIEKHSRPTSLIRCRTICGVRRLKIVRNDKDEPRFDAQENEDEEDLSPSSSASALSSFPYEAEMGAPVSYEIVKLEVRNPLGSSLLLDTKRGGSEDGALNVATVTLTVAVVDMGNPHCVVALDYDAHVASSAFSASFSSLPVEMWANAIVKSREGSKRWSECGGCNVSFVARLLEDETTGDSSEPSTYLQFRQRTVERGVGETHACASASCASAVALILLGLNKDREYFEAITRGGALRVSWSGRRADSIITRGPASEICHGIFPLSPDDAEDDDEEEEKLGREKEIDPVPSPPRIRLANLPTPVHAWPQFERLLAATFPGVPLQSFPKVYIKRDDWTGSGLSGNKVRKLEFLLADAIDQGATCVVTAGAMASNHCRATALAASTVGLDCYLILRYKGDMPPKPSLCGNLMLDRLSGAHVRLVSEKDYALAGGGNVLVRRLADRLSSTKTNGKRRKAYAIPVGGSNGVGTLGVVAMGVCDTPDIFYDDIDAIYATDAIRQHLQRHGDTAGAYTSLNARDLLTVVDVKGLGYGTSSKEELSFISNCARLTGMLLDPSYTGKAALGMLHHLRDRFVGDGPGSKNPEVATCRRPSVLFVHTGGMLGLYKEPCVRSLEVVLNANERDSDDVRASWRELDLS